MAAEEEEAYPESQLFSSADVDYLEEAVFDEISVEKLLGEFARLKSDKNRAEMKFSATLVLYLLKGIRRAFRFAFLHVVAEDEKLKQKFDVLKTALLSAGERILGDDFLNSAWYRKGGSGALVYDGKIIIRIKDDVIS